MKDMNDMRGGMNGSDNQRRWAARRSEMLSREDDFPVPAEIRSPSPVLPTEEEPESLKPTPPAGRALVSASAGSQRENRSGLQRAVGLVRAALPLVQRILPLLDGKIGTAASNFLGPYPQMAPPPPPLNLEPLEEGLAELKTQHRDLRNRILEHHASLKRIEDQLEIVRDANERNAQEQQELVEDLKGVQKKVNRFALLAFALLAGSVLLNVYLYLLIRHILP
jgi:hypothetical protein